MNIEINLVEASTELAHKEVEKHFDFNSSKIYKSVSDSITEYTDEAQSIFDENYDYFYDLLLNLKN
jgi:hypothetical protein